MCLDVLGQIAERLERLLQLDEGLRDVHPRVVGPGQRGLQRLEGLLRPCQSLSQLGEGLTHVATEALGLLAAGTTLLASDQAPDHLASAVDKLVGLIGEDTARAVSFDVPTPELVPVLRAAIENRHVVRIGYVGIATNERTQRDVEGWAVSFSRGNWYLTGYCRLARARRVFRVDRIDACEELDETFVLPSLRGDDGVGYRPSEDDASVSFTVEPSAGWVAEYYPVESEIGADGSVRITMSVSDPLTAARLLLQLGDLVSDVEGDEVLTERDALVGRIRTTYARTE